MAENTRAVEMLGDGCDGGFVEASEQARYPDVPRSDQVGSVGAVRGQRLFESFDGFWPSLGSSVASTAKLSKGQVVFRVGVDRAMRAMAGESGQPRVLQPPEGGRRRECGEFVTDRLRRWTRATVASHQSASSISPRSRSDHGEAVDDGDCAGRCPRGRSRSRWAWRKLANSRSTRSAQWPKSARHCRCLTARERSRTMRRAVVQPRCVQLDRVGRRRVGGSVRAAGVAELPSPCSWTMSPGIVELLNASTTSKIVDLLHRERWLLRCRG